jgi:hypothetical protein
MPLCYSGMLLLRRFQIFLYQVTQTLRHGDIQFFAALFKKAVKIF